MRKRAVIRCSTCKQTGHNAATCDPLIRPYKRKITPHTQKSGPLSPTTTTSCAECGNPVGDTNYYAPIGRDDAMVRLCKRCELEAVPNPKSAS